MSTVQETETKLGVDCRNESIVLLQDGKIRWIREESLTNIDNVDFLDLVLSDAKGELEE